MKALLIAGFMICLANGAAAAFADTDRVQSARELSWAGRFDEAVSLLRRELESHPDNREARVHLARVLSWAGKLEEAEAEAERVLASVPDDHEALVVKANIFRWRGDARSAIPLYEQALRQVEDFDARQGLAMAYLAAGDVRAARENRKLLRPLQPAQEKTLADLDRALCSAEDMRTGGLISHYSDSDHNKVNRYGFSFGLKTGAWDAAVVAGRTEADAPQRSIGAEDVRIAGTARFGRVSAGAGLGVTRTGEKDTDLASGHVRAGFGGARGEAGVSVAREILADTAQMIANRIARTASTVSLSQKPGQGLTLTEEYSRAGYSDGNRSDDFRFTATKTISAAFPSVAAGYRFRFLDFPRQSGGGYFDPEEYASHQAFVSLSAERGRWFARVEPFFGLQSFTRFGAKRDDFFSGASAAAGWNAGACVSFELNAEGGDYAGGAAAGFRYYMAGFSFKMNLW